MFSLANYFVSPSRMDDGRRPQDDDEGSPTTALRLELLPAVVMVSTT